MRIGELAEAAGCQTVTIRFYERKGLLPNTVRSGNNYRLYSQSDLRRITFILNCRALGLTLKEISHLIAIQNDPSSPCNEVNEYLDGHLAEVRRQRENLAQLEAELIHIRMRCVAPNTAQGCGVLSGLAFRRPK